MNTYTQTSYPAGPKIGAPGRLTEGSIHDTLTGAALEDGLLPGTLAVLDFSQASETARPGVRNAKVNELDIDLSGDMATGKTFAGTLKKTTIAGVETTHAISVEYGSSHGASMTAIRDAFDAIAGISASLPNSGGTNRKVRVTSDDASVTLSEHVTFTATGLTTTVTKRTTDVHNCVIGIDETQEKDADGLVEYDLKDDVPCHRLGRVYLDGETAMAHNATVHARIAGGNGLNEEVGKTGNAVGSPVVAVAVTGIRVVVPSAAADDTYVAEFNFIGR